MEPKFILSKSKILEQYNKLNPITDIISYSSKTNPIVTPILECETDCLFSIHLINELKNVKDYSRIVFLAQAWNELLISNLLKKGIKYFVVDNEMDLKIFEEYLKKTNIVKVQDLTLFLRLKLKENTIKTEKYFVFGMNSQFVNKKIVELKNNFPKLNLGIHFHRKTQNLSEWNYRLELEDSLDKNVFEIIKYLNIGGGIPSEYANTNIKVLDSVLNKIKELQVWLNTLKIKLIIEPGRFISAPAGKLVTEIISINENNIIVNSSVYNSDMDALIVPVKLLVENEVKKEEGKPFVIKGITPCSLDLFRYRVYLKNPKLGDKLVFLNAGAYNFSTNFCNLDEIKTEVVD